VAVSIDDEPVPAATPPERASFRTGLVETAAARDDDAEGLVRTWRDEPAPPSNGVAPERPPGARRTRPLRAT
jgi:hypothetical protein